LTLDGATIDDLALDFTLPGYEDVPLKVGAADRSNYQSISDTSDMRLLEQEGGSSDNVTLENLQEYIKLVYKVTLETGIAASVESFREGQSWLTDMSFGWCF
jgi:hypothetical protein